MQPFLPSVQRLFCRQSSVLSRQFSVFHDPAGKTVLTRRPAGSPAVTYCRDARHSLTVQPAFK
jgi:hypothetical protein